MAQLNDAMFTWLGAQPGVTGATLVDRRYSFFQLQGISSWREYYNNNAGTGQLNDWLLALFTA